jgi:hypothetical protein
MNHQLSRIRDLLLEATRLLDEHLASTVSVEFLKENLKDFLCESNGGIWNLRVANGKSSSIKFLLDGRLNTPSSGDRWFLDGRKLTLRWPNDKAPGGFWIDKLTASADGRSFEGTNQNGLPIRLSFRPTRQALSDSGPTDPYEFHELRSLVESKAWPEATFLFQVTDENSESDKQDRAEGIANIVLPPLKGKRFLDFGCGEGHLARFVSDEASVSVGYDIVKSGSLPWESEDERFLLTTDADKVSSMGPYDVILLYDVLDHVSVEMSEVLRSAGGFLSDDGVIIVRCHPWSSRHGGHVYRKINRAFVHLVLTNEEMSSLGAETPDSQRIILPIQVYENAIKASGLSKHKGPDVDMQDVEPFFWNQPLVRSRIFRAFGLQASSDAMPTDQMSICFVDYWLKK